MQSLAKIATEIDPESLDSQSALEKLLPTSDLDERRAVLAEILFSDRASAQYDSRETEDLDILVSTVLPLTRSIPTNYLPECYVVALEARQPGDNMQIRGVELLNAWKVIEGRVEMESKGAYENKTRLLTSNARGACSRCFGTGFERMPDGTVRPGCPHDQWTDDDQLTTEENEAEWRAFVQKQAEAMREIVKKAATPAPPRKDGAKPPAGLLYKCSSCRRTLDVLRELDGAPCNDLLNRGTHDGELKTCRGTFVRAHLHECRIESCERFKRRVVAIPGEACPACGEGLEREGA